MSTDASGLIGNVRGLAANGARAVRTRLELIAIELQMEKARAVRSLVLGAATIYLLSFGTLAGILWIVMGAPEERRGLILGGIALAFLVLGGCTLAWLLYFNSRAKPLLETTIAVLKSDEHALAGTRS